MRQNSFLLVSSSTCSHFVLPTTRPALAQGEILYRNETLLHDVMFFVIYINFAHAKPMFSHMVFESPPPKEGLLSPP